MNPSPLGRLESTLRWFGLLSLAVIHLPVLATAQEYPGTGEDFTLATAINSFACPTGTGQDIKVAGGGDSLYVCLDSPGGVFSGSPVALVAECCQPVRRFPAGYRTCGSASTATSADWVLPVRP